MNAERLTAVKFNVLLDRSFSGPEWMFLSIFHNLFRVNFCFDNFAPVKLVPSYLNFLHKVSTKNYSTWCKHIQDHRLYQNIASNEIPISVKIWVSPRIKEIDPLRFKIGI